MSQNKTECSTCTLINELRARGKYYVAKHPDRRNQGVSVCKSVVVVEDYYNVDDQMEFGGRASYNPRPLNFCPECGRRFREDELQW